MLDEEVNCFGCVLYEYPRSKNMEPIAKASLIDNYNAYGQDIFDPDKLDQLPDKIEFLLQQNFKQLGSGARLHPGDVISWDQPIRYRGGEVWNISHVGLYVQQEGNLVFSKVGQKGAYLLLPTETLAKLYGKSTRYWRPIAK